MHRLTRGNAHHAGLTQVTATGSAVSTSALSGWPAMLTTALASPMTVLNVLNFQDSALLTPALAASLLMLRYARRFVLECSEQHRAVCRLAVLLGGVEPDADGQPVQRCDHQRLHGDWYRLRRSPACAWLSRLAAVASAAAAAVSLAAADFGGHSHVCSRRRDVQRAADVCKHLVHLLPSDVRGWRLRWRWLLLQRSRRRRHLVNRVRLKRAACSAAHLPDGGRHPALPGHRLQRVHDQRVHVSREQLRHRQRWPRVEIHREPGAAVAVGRERRGRLLPAHPGRLGLLHVPWHADQRRRPFPADVLGNHSLGMVHLGHAAGLQHRQDCCCCLSHLQLLPADDNQSRRRLVGFAVHEHRSASCAGCVAAAAVAAASAQPAVASISFAATSTADRHRGFGGLPVHQPAARRLDRNVHHSSVHGLDAHRAGRRHQPSLGHRRGDWPGGGGRER